MKEKLNTKQTTEDYVVVATKISRPCAAQLQALATAKGISQYELVQMVCDTLVRYMSSEHNLSAEMEKAMAIFEHMVGWADALNLADPTGHKEIGEAIYFIHDSEGKKKGVRAIHVRMPYFGDWQQSENIQTILERTLNLIFPERYKRLRQLAVDMECNCILELIDTLIDTHAQDSDVRELRAGFENANRADNGLPIEYGHRYVRKHHRTPDSIHPTLDL